MADLSSFPITQRWPAQNPDIIQLYSFPTPNGLKVSIALEELGLPYEAQRVTISDADVKSPEFLSLNPNNKIPAIIDPNGPDGAAFGLFESGAILIYLGEKTGKLLGANPRQKHETIQWIMFQMGGLGPMFGQTNFFLKYAGKAIEDPRPGERYLSESKRLLQVLEKALEGRDWITGDYSMADIAICPWLASMRNNYEPEILDINALPNVSAYIDRFRARPAVQRAQNVPPREA